MASLLDIPQEILSQICLLVLEDPENADPQQSLSAMLAASRQMRAATLTLLPTADDEVVPRDPRLATARQSTVLMEMEDDDHPSRALLMRRKRLHKLIWPRWGEGTFFGSSSATTRHSGSTSGARALFGLPTTTEEDSMRPVRAADLRELERRMTERDKKLEQRIDYVLQMVLRQRDEIANLKAELASKTREVVALLAGVSRSSDRVAVDEPEQPELSPAVSTQSFTAIRASPQATVCRARATSDKNEEWRARLRALRADVAALRV